jgi:hypothetical protein
MIATINNVLAQLKPFIVMIALVFGFIAAWHGLGELLPIVKQIWSPRGSAQSMALVGAALAIIAGRT